MWGQLYSSNRETVLGTPILNVRPVTWAFTPTADHWCWSCSMLGSDVRSDVVLCETPRLLTFAPLANPTITWQTVLMEKQWLFTSENKESLPWNVSFRITGALWVKRGERGIFSRKRDEGRRKRSERSSPRLALRAKCRVRLTWLVKRLLCRLQKHKSNYI